MGSLYTPEVARYLERMFAPLKDRFKWEVGEQPDNLVFVMWADNVASLTGDEMMQVHNILNTCLSKISQSGIPIFVHKLPGDGKIDA